MCLGVPGQIVEITDREQNLARVEVSGVKRSVNLACVLGKDQTADDLVGEWVLVHVGFAMSLINEQEAQRTLDILAELGELQAELSLMSPQEGRKQG